MIQRNGEQIMKQKIRLHNLDDETFKELYILRVETGAHPDNVKYLRSQYEDVSEFDEFYEEEDFETTYLSDGTWFQTDLLTYIHYTENRSEVDFELIDIELSA